MGLGQIQNCYSTGSVIASGRAGGLAGTFSNYDSTDAIFNTYSFCSVTGNTAGGLIGYAYSGTINASYAAGPVSGSTIGGLIGENLSATVINSFFDNQTTGDASASDTSKGIPVTTAGMKNPETFSNANWQIAALPGVLESWYILPGEDYPRLSFTLPTDVSIGNEEQYQYFFRPDVTVAVDATGEAKIWNSTSDYVLVNDIVLTQPAASFGGQDNPFSGSFDGQNFTISNLLIEEEAENDVGMFSAAGSGAVIRNIRIENASVTGDTNVSVLVGFASSSDAPIVIDNCHVGGDIYGSKSAGGFAGAAANVTISNSSFGGMVFAADSQSGGLVGGGRDSVILSSYTDAAVQSDSNAGGLAGYFDGLIENAYATGTVSASGGDAGGLVGNTSNLLARNSFALNQKVDSPSNAGRILGANSGVISMTNNYAWENISNAEGDFVSDADMNGVAVSSADVWDTFPNTVWNNLENAGDWTLNTHSDYKLPMLNSQSSFIADASYLAPVESDGGNGSNGGGGSGMGSVRVVENNEVNTANSTGSGSTGSGSSGETTPIESYAEEILPAGEIPPAFPWWILLLLLLIAIAVYVRYRMYQKKD
jgi:hypothetical protein